MLGHIPYRNFFTNGETEGRKLIVSSLVEGLLEKVKVGSDLKVKGYMILIIKLLEKKIGKIFFLHFSRPIKI